EFGALLAPTCSLVYGNKAELWPDRPSGEVTSAPEADPKHVLGRFSQCFDKSPGDILSPLFLPNAKMRDHDSPALSAVEEDVTTARLIIGRDDDFSLACPLLESAFWVKTKPSRIGAPETHNSVQVWRLFVNRLDVNCHLISSRS